MKDTLPFKWKLREVLQQRDITPYRLMHESGISHTTIYRIVNGYSQTLNGRVLEQLLETLERITGEKFTITDLVEWERPNG